MYKTTGFISFVLRRLTGVVLVLYLFTHMWVIGSMNQGPAAFDARLAVVQSPLFKLGEVALLAAVVYHALDGIRLLMVNWFGVTNYRKSLFYAVLAVAVILVIAGGIPMIMFMFEEMG